jgi:integrase
MRRSKRPDFNSARSRISGPLVAARRMSPVEESNPSSSAGNWFEVFSGHSLRGGLASSADIEERYVQKQLGHASGEMTRKYQRRRDCFRTNLIKKPVAKAKSDAATHERAEAAVVLCNIWSRLRRKLTVSDAGIALPKR